MEGNARLETVITHLTGTLLVLLGVATWLTRWLVNSWIARARMAPAA